jgi:hypothetical protein
MAKSGQEIFQEHMGYVGKQDIVGMVNNTYTDDAVLYHTFDFFETKPPHVVQGKEAIIKAQQTIFGPEAQGQIQAGEPFNFVATEEYIAFQIQIVSPNTGTWIVNDVWILRDDKIARQFVLGTKIAEPR